MKDSHPRPANWCPFVLKHTISQVTSFIVALCKRRALKPYPIFFGATNGRPPCIHSATTTMRVPSSCLLWTTCERPTSSATFVRLTFVRFNHAQNFTKTKASMARCERHLCHTWTTEATCRPPLCLQRRPGWFCGRTMEAQRSQPLCKGCIRKQSCKNAQLINDLIITIDPFDNVCFMSFLINIVDLWIEFYVYAFFIRRFHQNSR